MQIQENFFFLRENQIVKLYSICHNLVKRNVRINNYKGIIFIAKYLLIDNLYDQEEAFFLLTYLFENLSLLSIDLVQKLRFKFKTFLKIFKVYDRRVYATIFEKHLSFAAIVCENLNKLFTNLSNLKLKNAIFDMILNHRATYQYKVIILFVEILSKIIHIFEDDNSFVQNYQSYISKVLNEDNIKERVSRVEVSPEQIFEFENCVVA